MKNRINIGYIIIYFTVIFNAINLGLVNMISYIHRVYIDIALISLFILFVVVIGTGRFIAKLKINKMLSEMIINGCKFYYKSYRNDE